jgi:hypothetical protein
VDFHLDTQEENGMTSKLALASVLAAIVALTGLSSPTNAAKDDKKVVAVKGTKAKAPGQDANIKNRSEKNNPKATATAPPSKGGPSKFGTSRLCRVMVDNHTQWKVQVYIDGDYEGLVGPYGELYTVSTPGATKFYARADFTDGSVITWGPTIYQLSPGGTFTWKLN